LKINYTLMKLDNRKKIYQIWFRKFLATIILTILIILFGYSDYFKTPVLGIDRTWYLVVLTIIYIGFMVFNSLLKPNFVSFSDNGDKIVLRYYPARIMNSKKNSIEISKQSFVSWEIKKFFFGTREMLYLYGKFKSGVARYPGISLSMVNRRDREKIKSTLDTYSKKE
jgi:hypothetical protein